MSRLVTGARGAKDSMTGAATRSVIGPRARRGIAIAAAIALAAHAARAQDRTIPARLSPPTRAAVEQLIDSARAAGLPVDPLYSKVQEGVFRGADDARVLAAARRLAHDLRDARLALGDSVTAEEIAAGANALRAGMRPPDLSRLRDARRQGRQAGQPLTVALVVLADLAMRGVPPAVASASVTELVTRDVPDNALNAFRQTVERDLQSGRTPAAAVDARTRAVIEDMGRVKP